MIDFILQKTYAYRSIIKHMRRRRFLAAAALTTTGSVAGCLGSGADDGSPSDGDDPPADDTDLEDGNPSLGRSQWGYDARNSRYATGMSGPTEEPAVQRVYEHFGGEDRHSTVAAPLTADDAFYLSNNSMEIDGETRWDVSLPGRSVAYPALYKGTVLNAASDLGLFWALSMADGTAEWHTELSSDARPNGSWTPGERIAVADDHAYYATYYGVGCVDLAAREQAWGADLHSLFPGSLKGGWRAPVATEEHVFALKNPTNPERDFGAHPQQLYALDPETGELAWTAHLELEGDGFGFTHPVVGDQYVFVAANVNENSDADAKQGDWVRVMAVDPAAGEVVWTRTIPGILDGLLSVANGHLYVSHGGGTGKSPLLSALSTDDGSDAWTVETTWLALVPTVTDTLVYVFDAPGVRAFDPETGDERWQIDLLEHADVPDLMDVSWVSQSPPVVHDGRLFVYLGQGWMVGLW